MFPSQKTACLAEVLCRPGGAAALRMLVTLCGEYAPLAEAVAVFGDTDEELATRTEFMTQHLQVLLTGIGPFLVGNKVVNSEDFSTWTTLHHDIPEALRNLDQGEFLFAATRPKLIQGILSEIQDLVSAISTIPIGMAEKVERYRSLLKAETDPVKIRILRGRIRNNRAKAKFGLEARIVADHALREIRSLQGLLGLLGDSAA